MPELGAQALGPADLRGREREPVVDVLDEVLLHHAAPLGQLFLVARHHGHAAAREHDLPQPREVRMRLLDAGAEAAKHLGGGARERADLVVDGRDAEIAAPRQAQAAHARAPDGVDEGARVHGIGDRRARIGARDHREHQRGVGDGTRHGAADAPWIPRERRRMVGHEAGRGAEADHAAERRGQAQRAAEIGALGQRAEAGGERDGAAARRAARRERRVPRVARDAEDLVEGVGARAKLRRVGLAHHDRPRRLQPRDDQRVFLGHVMLVDLAAPRGADALGRREVLDRHRHAVQRTEARAAPGRRRRLLRGLQRRLGGHRAVGVQARVHALEAGEHRLHEVERRDRAARDQRDELRGRHEAEIAVSHRAAPFARPWPGHRRGRRRGRR